jgi:hypothetical protein
LPPVPSIPVAPAVFPDEPIRDDIDELLDLELPVARADSPSPAQLNPYQSPSSDNNPQRVVRRGEIEITRVAYGDVMRTSWRIYKANLGAGLVVTIITMFCSGLLQSLVVALMPVLAVAARNLGLGEAAVFPIMGLSLLAQLFLLTFFLCGLISFSLDTARGRPTGVGAVFSAGPHLVSGAGVLLVALCGVVAGAFLLVVPSLICAILLALAPVVLVDRDEGMLPSLTLSARVMLKNFLPAFLLLISVGIVSNLITLITCGLGILLVAPFQLFLLVTLYLRATGQRTAYD